MNKIVSISRKLWKPVFFQDWFLNYRIYCDIIPIFEAVSLSVSEIGIFLRHCTVGQKTTKTGINSDTENSYKFNIIILTFYKCTLNQLNYINFNLQGKFSASDLPSLCITFESEIQYLH